MSLRADILAELAGGNYACWETGDCQTPDKCAVEGECPWLNVTPAEPRGRADILAEAAEIITRDRNATHGEPEDSFGLIAALWSAYLGQTIQPHEVATLMELLKIARRKGNPDNRDNWVDAAGYVGCGAELALGGEQ